MALDRSSLLRVCDDLLTTGISNVVRDGFLIETLLGFLPSGEISTFVAATDGINADLTRAHVDDGDNVTVINGRLIDSAALIALDLRRQNTRCVAHLASGHVETTGETFVISTVVWPEQILISSLIALWYPGEPPRITDGGNSATPMYAWLTELLPEPIIA